jgi:acetyltransferase-like isoleucine patch superfamily enzyme
MVTPMLGRLEIMRFLEQIPAWQESRSLHHLIGSFGYTVPGLDTEKFTIIRADQAASKFGNLIIHGASQKSNFIAIPDDHIFREKFHIMYSEFSHHNILVIGNKSEISGTIKFNGQHGLCVFGGHNVHLSSFYIVITDSNSTFFCGSGGSSNGLNAYISGDDRSIIVGNDVMVAQRPNILTSDMHGIVDIRSGEWINKPADVIIEPHVWLGMEASILKGNKIGFGSVVGTKSVVTKNVPRRCVVTGIPAKVVKSEICWTRSSQPNPNNIAAVEEIGLHFPSISDPAD